jgi:hypothetical protein
MPRTRPLRAGASAAVGAVIALCAFSLAGCASGTSGTSGLSADDAADAESIAERASLAGISPDLVYTTEVDGYDLAPQSVGRVSDDGMSATWVDVTTGVTVTIRTDRGELTAASCADMPLWDAPDEPVTCTDEDGLWHRSGAGSHEYIAVRDGALIWVIGDGAPPSDLLAAAQAVRVPSDAELELLFSDLPEVATTPVERGDLPDNGDGAPIDPVGPGG